jgi:hypothetical protein
VWDGVRGGGMKVDEMCVGEVLNYEIKGGQGTHTQSQTQMHTYSNTHSHTHTQIIYTQSIWKNSYSRAHHTELRMQYTYTERTSCTLCTYARTLLVAVSTGCAGQAVPHLAIPPRP